MTHTVESWGTGWGRTPRALLRDPDISINAKALFGLLEDYANGDGAPAFPKLKRLAGYLGCSVDTVRRALCELHEAGWITKEQRFADGGRQTTNRYRMLSSPLATVQRVGVAPTRGGGVAPTRGHEEEPEEEEPEEEQDLPPTPSGGADVGGALFDESVGKPKERRARRETIAPLTGMRSQLFELWWKRYPKKSGKDAARKAWAKFLHAGGSVGELEARLTAYQISRTCYRDVWGRDAPAMNASTFVNSRSEDFEDGPVSPVDLNWPAEPGSSWDKWIGDQEWYERDFPESVSPWFRKLIAPKEMSS